MRQFLARNHFKQVPQMCSEQFIQLDMPFITYQAKRRGKTAVPSCPASQPPFPSAAPAGPPSPMAGGIPMPAMAMFGHPAPMAAAQVPMQAPISPQHFGMHHQAMPAADHVDHRIARLHEELAQMRTPTGADANGHVDHRIARLQEELHHIRSGGHAPVSPAALYGHPGY